MSFLIYEPRIARGIRVDIQIDKFGEHLSGNDILNITQVAETDGSIRILCWGQLRMPEIRIKIMAQIIHGVLCIFEIHKLRKKILIMPSCIQTRLHAGR
jgi:hypothetical protein